MISQILKDTLTYSFLIPNVSRLLIFKDHWNDSQLIRKIAAGLLREGCFIKLYCGNDLPEYCNEFYAHHTDCAIVSITIKSLSPRDYEIEKIEDLFISEIGNDGNTFSFENTKLSWHDNVCYSAITVTLPAPQTAPHIDETAAA